MRRAFTLVEIVIIVALVAVLAAFLWPLFVRARENNRRSSCQSNLKQIGLGFFQYTRDYDEKFPPARATPTAGWVDVLMPYIKSPQLFHCPSATITVTKFTSDYFYNRRFSRRNMNQMSEPRSVILSGEGPAGATTWSSWLSLPADATTNVNSPAQRHVGYAAYLFGDGHVKNLQPTQIGQSTPSPTFIIR